MPRPVYFFLLANLLAGALARGQNAAKEPIDQLIPLAASGGWRVP